MKRGFNVLFLSLATAFWGLSVVSQAVGGRTMRPFTFNSARFAVSVAALLPCLWLFRSYRTFANTKRELRPGMYARVTVDYGANDSIVVPDAAVIKQQGSGQRNVFVLQPDNTVAMRTVTVGRHFGMNYEILSGLEVGDQVLTGGHTNLKAGDKVEVQR